jgi:hypothetical protein
MYKSKYLNETLNSRKSHYQNQPSSQNRYSSVHQKHISTPNSQPKIYQRKSIAESNGNTYFEPGKFRTGLNQQKKSPSSYIDKYLTRIKVEKNLFEDDSKQVQRKSKISNFDIHNSSSKNFYRSMGDKMYSSALKNPTIGAGRSGRK